MNLITIKDMDISLELNGLITCVIGPSNSGKTILAKKLCNKLDNKDVFIDEISIKEYDYTFLRNNIVVVLDDNNFACDYVAEEMFYYINKLGYRIDEITKKIDNLSKIFKISDLLNQRISMLSLEYKMLVKILSYLIINPKLIVIDNIISYLSSSNKKLLIKYIRQNNISLINITCDMEDLLFSDNVVVMNNFKAVICSEVSSVIEGNSILPYMGLKLPFIIDLSHNLILYGIINKIYTDSRKLVDKIWK